MLVVVTSDYPLTQCGLEMQYLGEQGILNWYRCSCLLKFLHLWIQLTPNCRPSLSYPLHFASFMSFDLLYSFFQFWNIFRWTFPLSLLNVNLCLTASWRQKQNTFLHWICILSHGNCSYQFDWKFGFFVVNNCSEGLSLGWKGFSSLPQHCDEHLGIVCDAIWVSTSLPSSSLNSSDTDRSLTV